LSTLSTKEGALNLSRHDQADRTRAEILQAASREFRRHGFDGTSTVAITEAANVNASLLYYYFKNKLGLYKAVVQSAIEEIAVRTSEGLSASGTAGERLLRAVVLHFDRFITHGEATSLMQQELLRRSEQTEEIMAALDEGVLRPTIAKFGETFKEGIETGELKNVDWQRALGAILGANANYFLTAPVFKVGLQIDPLSRRSLESQRQGIVEFWAAILFTDPEKGAQAADRVFKELPFPEMPGSIDSRNTRIAEN
jgi:AcrR family transcriptional regulator